MNLIIRFLKNKWCIQSIGLIALCGVVWYAGPYFGFAGVRPLSPPVNRLLTMLVAVIVWTVYHLIRQARSGKTDEKLTEKMAAVDEGRTSLENRQKEEQEILRKKFKTALDRLKETRGKGRRDKRFLYELPWYVIIGAPGCGKTTLLKKSGINFPLDDYMDAKDVIKGVGGTRNCDWLFTDDAIFLDTAGRYTTQDSFRAVDEAAWKEFLKLLKTYRSRRPINGILVAANAYELIRKTDEDRKKHAREIRQRILEIHAELGIQFPIYMLFTKCDLISGFAHFFSDLHPEERAQVWGRTFSEIDTGHTNAHLNGFHNDFDELINRLNQQTLNRIHEERDNRRRSLILGFPRQMALVKPVLTEFIKKVFSSSAYDKKPLLLRGVYFTSATQEGAPLDRIMDILSKTYGFDDQNVATYGGEGKSYFIFDLLKKVILPESELAGADVRVERRRRLLTYSAYGAVMFAAVAVLIAWAVSYMNNDAYIEKVQARVADFNNIPSDAEDWETGVKSLHRRLNVLKSMGQIHEADSSWKSMGLDQSDKINGQIDGAYEKRLTNALLPAVKTRMEQRLSTQINRRAFTDGNEPDGLFDLLKVYLTLARTPQERLEDIDLAVETIAEDWDESFHREGKDFKKSYRDHFRDLLTLDAGALLSPSSLNTVLISRARRRLNEEALHKQIYDQLKSQYMQDRTYEFRLENIAGVEEIFDISKSTLRHGTIPGLFTYAGYNEIFNKQGIKFVEKTLRQNWVTRNPQAEKADDTKKIYDDLKQIYFIEYIRRWDNLISNLSVKKSKNIDHTIRMLHRLSSKPNPLELLLKEIETNTSFLKGIQDVSTDSDRTIKKLQRLNKLVETKDDQPPILNDVVKKLEELRDFMYGMESPEMALNNLKNWNRGGEDKISSATHEFERLPEPLNKWLSAVASSGRKAALSSTKSALNDAWRSDVYDIFSVTMAGRYPFARYSSDNVELDDFIRFFRPEGILETFLKEHIKPFVDADWQEKSRDGGKLGLSDEALLQFKRAETIRKIFFSESGELKIKFSLTPQKLDNSVKEFQLTIDGKTIRYQFGPLQTENFEWPGNDRTQGVEWAFKPFNKQTVRDGTEGPWAWFRALDKVRFSSAGRNRFIITFRAGGYEARYLMKAGSSLNPFDFRELQYFTCPESL